MHSPVYIERPCSPFTAALLKYMALDMGIEPVDDPHITLAYSRAAVDMKHPAIQPLETTEKVEGLFFKLDRFFDNIVVRFDHPAFRERFEALREAGCSWDFPEYNQHVTIGRDPEKRFDPQGAEVMLPGGISFEREFIQLLDPEPAPEEIHDVAPL